MAGYPGPGEQRRSGAPDRRPETGFRFRPQDSASRLPATIDPMLPAAAGQPFDSSDCIFEVLWDGVRAIAFAEGGRLRLQSRYGGDISSRYPEVAAASGTVRGAGLALDGEIVALDEHGLPDFGRLRTRLNIDSPAEAARLAGVAPVTFQAFDILYRDGRSVMNEPLRTRKNMLRQVVALPDTIIVPDFVEREGSAFFEAAREHGLEGIIAKEVESRYEPGRRSKAWLMLKVYQKDEFIVAGFTYGGPIKSHLARRPQRHFSALLLGLFDRHARLQYAGEVSGGFSEAAYDELLPALDEATAQECPFATPPALERLVFWCRPQVVATIRYSEWDARGQLRFAVFETLRPDVPPASCLLSESA